MNILVRVPNWIGDAVMCLPALSDLRQCFLTSSITILAKPTIAELLREQCGMNDILIYQYQTEHRGILGFLKLSHMIRRKAFDTAVLFQNAFEAAALAFLACIPNRIGYATDGRGWLLSNSIPLPALGSSHQTGYYQQLVQVMTQAPSHDPIPKLSGLTVAKLDSQSQLLEWPPSLETLLIGINPGSIYGSAKRWPYERFAEVGDQLVDQMQKTYPEVSSVRCVIIGGKGEEGLGREIGNRMRSQPIVLSGKTSIRGLLDVLRRCTVLITNDTGPMHMAQALEVPVVALFGSTDPETTGPSGKEHCVIREPVRCSPCLLRSCPIDHRCMMNITTGQVVKSVMDRMDAYVSAYQARASFGS